MVDPLVLVRAVAQLETSDGKKVVGIHNLFNIKDPSGKGSRALDKKEGSNDAYKGYTSRQESIDDFIGLLSRRYPEAHKALQEGDAEGFVAGMIKGGYATDPKYKEKLTKTIESIHKRHGV